MTLRVVSPSSDEVGFVPLLCYRRGAAKRARDRGDGVVVSLRRSPECGPRGLRLIPRQSLVALEPSKKRHTRDRPGGPGSTHQYAIAATPSTRPREYTHRRHVQGWIKKHGLGPVATVDRRVASHVAPGARRPAPHAYRRCSYGPRRADGAGDARHDPGVPRRCLHFNTSRLQE